MAINNEKRQSLNALIYCFLVIGIIRLIYGIFSIWGSSYHFDGKDIVFDAFNFTISLVLNITSIASLIFILCKRKIGLYIFACLNIITVILTPPAIIASTIKILVLYFVLQLKADGISGWTAITGRKWNFKKTH